MKIILPKEAEQYYNSKIEEYLFLLKPEPSKPKNTQPSLSNSHIPTNHILTDDLIIGTTILSTRDGFGNEHSKYFSTDNGFIGLVEADYSTLKVIIDKLSTRKEISQYLTAEYIIKTVFKWFEERYKGVIPQEQSFMDYFYAKAEKDIKEYKIGIPLSYINIQNPFVIGKVTFDFYKKEFFDELQNEMSQKHSDFDPDSFNKHIRKKYQGVVFANISLCAEQERCVKIATEETEKALMVLRFLSPSTFVPLIPSYFGRLGHANLPVSHYFIFEDKLPMIKSGIDEDKDFNLTINSDFYAMMKTMGIDQLSNLISKDSLNDLEKLVLNSISLFTKGIVSHDHQVKVVFCLASIETLLLKNTSEPIQHSVGLRLAFLTSKEPAHRKETIELIKNAYEIRSSYLHHGKLKEDINTLTELQQTIWTGLKNALASSTKFTNQIQLIDYLENIILT